MSDEKTAMAAAVASVLGPRSLRVVHTALVIDQDAGTVGVKLTGEGAPSATAKPVPVLFGLPGFSASFKPNAEISVGFHNGAEDGAYASMFPYFPKSAPEVPLPLPIEWLAFGGGSQPIARVDDSVGCGALVFRQVPVGPGGVPSTLTISYRSELGAETTILSFPIPGPALFLSQDQLDPTAASVPIDGLITSGREEFLA